MKDIDLFRNKTRDPSFKGAIFNYMTQILYLNQLNHKNFTYKICREQFLTNQMVFYWHKDFYLLNEFDDKITALAENGLIDQWMKTYINSRYMNLKEPKRGPMPLNFYHLLGSFEVFVGGVLVAGTCFLLEAVSSIDNLSYLKFIFD